MRFVNTHVQSLEIKIIEGTVVHKRKERVLVTKNILKSLWKMKFSGDSTKYIANTLDLSTRTVQFYIEKIESHGVQYIESFISGRPGKKSNDKSAKISEILEIVQDDPSLTLRGITERLGNPTSLSYLHKVMKKGDITRKRIKYVADKSVDESTIIRRKDYARILSNLADCNIFFLDETGFNLHCSSKYGYALSGRNAVVTHPANKGTNISVIYTIGYSGIVHFEHIQGAYNTLKFESFLKNLIPIILTLTSSPVLVMDNVRFHHSQVIKSLLTSKGIRVVYLPAYSPDLNPIENMFSSVKGKLHSMRLRACDKPTLITYIEKSFKSFTDAILFSNLYQHMRSNV